MPAPHMSVFKNKADYIPRDHWQAPSRPERTRRSPSDTAPVESCCSHRAQHGLSVPSDGTRTEAGCVALPPLQALPYDDSDKKQRVRRPLVERFNIWPPGMYHRKIGGQHLFSTVVVVRGA